MGFRRWLETDIPSMAAISANPEVMRFFPSTQDYKHTERFVHEMNAHFDKYGYCYYAVDQLSSGDFIGFIGLKWIEMDFGSFTDIGWRLAPEFWGFGYATEGAKRCLNHGFQQLKIKKMYAIAPSINAPSIHVMKKAGLHFERVFDHPLLKDYERLHNCVLYFKECSPSG